MAQQQLGIEDGSNDKRYFTLIPNYILNHSTHWDREVYIQMKRIAGEDGTCYLSIGNLMKQCGLSKERLNKSIKYLLNHEWIKFKGQRTISTKGGSQYVNEYKITDLWNLNNKYYQEQYKGGSPDDQPCEKGGSPNLQRGVAEGIKGGSPDDHKEEHIEEEPIKEELISETSFAGKEINDLIYLFKNVNPSYGKFFGNKTQRKAIERMVKVLGREKLEGAINTLPKTNKMPFAPVITTPLQLEDKLAALMSFILKEKIKTNGKSVAIL